MQFSVAVRNAMLDAIETTIGTSAKLQLRTGAQPANCASADSGTLLIEYALASDWMANAGSGAKILNGLPISGAATGTGVAGHYRFKDTAATTCHEQGTVGLAGTILSVSVADGGTGYASVPTVAFVGGGGSGAAATAVVTANVVTGITITNPGSGYTSAPVVELTGGTPTRNAAATCLLPEIGVDNTSINATQTVQITTYTKTMGGA